jgi:hypothetical protein
MKNLIKKISILFLLFVMIAGLISFNVQAEPGSANISITVGKPSKTGVPGSTVSYKVSITNNDAVELALKLSVVSTGGWTTPVVVPDALTIPAGETQGVVVNVPIPSSAIAGQNDIATFYVKDATDTVLGTLQLTTLVASSPTPVTGRPLVVIASYSTGDAKLYAGSELNLQVKLRNDGQSAATNVVVTFDGADFYPKETGGVRTAGTIGAGESTTISQKFLIGDALAWANVAPIKATVTYTDSAGTAYSESFTISVVITEPSGGSIATATPNIPARPQLVVTGYTTDIDPLQPGSIFEITLDVKNLGNADAKSVTAVVGGGVSSGGDISTPQAGGISGSGGDLTTFAPLGSSNVIFVGDINKDAVASINQKLVVNVTAAPGAYTLKLSFVYSDAKGNRLVDDQVITLLIYSLPQVEVSFYRDPGMFSAGMENILPLQITNLGKKTYVLGNMKVTAENADVYNNVLMVGALDPGGYFTLDASLMPYQEGPLELKIQINYTDDFNQPRTIDQVIPVEILPAPEIPPEIDNGTGGGGVIVEPVQETFWQKVVRFFKGLFGAGSGKDEQPVNPEIPPEDVVVPVIPKG